MNKKRRRTLKFGSIIAWSTPLVSSISLPAHAQTSAAVCTLNNVDIELITPSSVVANGDLFRIDILYNTTINPNLDLNQFPIALDAIIDIPETNNSLILATNEIPSTTGVLSFNLTIDSSNFEVNTTTLFTSLSGRVDIFTGGDASTPLGPCIDGMTFNIPISLTVNP